MRAYFGTEGNDIVLDRHFSHGYKRLVLDKGLHVADKLNFQTDGVDTLRAVSGGSVDSEGVEYTFVCKEFGLYDKNMAKVSIIFCDDGDMLVTLKGGTLLFMFNNELLQPVVGDGEYDSVHPTEICWVNADRLIGMKQYFGQGYEGSWHQDFEYVFETTGERKNGLDKFNVKCCQDEYIDLSLGYVAECMKRDREREAAKQRERELLENDRRSMEELMKAYAGITEADLDDEAYYDDEDDWI